MKVMVPVTPEKALLTSTLTDVNPPLWGASTSYAVKDTVTYSDGVYFAKAANTAKYPDREPEIWAYMHPATPETWTAEKTYAAGDIVLYKRGLYTSMKAANTGYIPGTASEWWSSMGPVNSWATFDSSINTKSAAVDAMEFTLDFSGCNGLALFGLEGASVTMKLTNSAGNTFLEKTIALTGIDVTSWFQYFLEPRTPREDVVMTSLPIMAYSRLTLNVNAPGGIARVGHVAIGRIKEIGKSQYGMENGITDYSRKSTDTFGNTYLSVGKWAKTARMDLHVWNKQYDDVFRTLAKIRATPTVFVGDNSDNGLDSFTVWGFVRDFRMVVEGPLVSQCSLEIQGLI